MKVFKCKHAQDEYYQGSHDVPDWYQTWMDDDNYPIWELCERCSYHITDWKNDSCHCMENDPSVDIIWKCTLCDILIGNDIRDDYCHMNESHPDYMVMGRLGHAN